MRSPYIPAVLSLVRVAQSSTLPSLGCSRFYHISEGILESPPSGDGPYWRRAATQSQRVLPLGKDEVSEPDKPRKQLDQSCPLGSQQPATSQGVAVNVCHEALGSIPAWTSNAGSALGL
ncbi:hypothetical protein BDW68DRAFT_160015, partial [Aspergillus falconensis]